MEQIKQNECPLCSSANFEILASVDKYKYIQCKGCGLAFINPLPSLPAREEVDFLSYKFHLISEPKFNWSDFKRHNEYERQFKVFQKYISAGTPSPPTPTLPSARKILDIGCHNGYYLFAAKINGYDGYGVEVLPEASKYARNSFGVKVITGRFEDIVFPCQYFDGVRLSHVLEHLPDPVGALKKVNKIMKPNGVLELGVPNPESFINFSRNLYHWMRGRFRRDKFSFDLCPPEHLYSFPKKTLKLLLRKTGFTPLRTIVIGKGNKIYHPFIFVPNIRVIVDEVIDLIGNVIERGEVLHLYARKVYEVKDY